MTLIKKAWQITDIERLTEREAAELAEETLTINGHTIYLIDFGGYFGYSMLVFMHGVHFIYANDYGLHHSNTESRAELRALYISEATERLYAEEQLAEPLTDYDDYSRREYYIRNFYGLLSKHYSIFRRSNDPEIPDKSRLTYDPISFGYYEDGAFVRHHRELFDRLVALASELKNDFPYQKEAFLREMWNHEYGYNWQGDYDVCRTFGNVEYHGDEEDELQKYFDELGLTKTQRRAYLAARKEYYRTANL